MCVIGPPVVSPGVSYGLEAANSISNSLSFRQDGKVRRACSSYHTEVGVQAGIPMSEQVQESPPTLDQAIENAQGLTTVLGIIFLVASIAQALGWVQAGVPAWLNIAIAVAVLVLAQLLPKKALPVVVALVVIFVVLTVDTLMATGFVLENWGVVPTVIVVVRYLILLGATQQLAEVGKLLWKERTMAERIAAFKEIDQPRVPGDSPAPAAEDSIAKAEGMAIDVSHNSSALVFRVMSALLVVGGLIFGGGMLAAGETEVAMAGFLLMPAMAFGVYYVAGIEERYLPGLIAKLKEAAEVGELEACADVRAKLVAAKHRGSRALAAEIVNHRMPADSTFVKTAADIIAEIGTLDDDAAFALKRALGGSGAAATTLGKLFDGIQ